MPHINRQSHWVGVRVGVGALMILAATPTARGQTSYPMVTRVEPTAIARGAKAELTIGGLQNFGGASAVLFEGKGLTGKLAEGASKSNVTIQAPFVVEVAADAALGPREVRVVTPQGVSSTGLVVVTSEPVVVEADDRANDTAAGAQQVKLPIAIAGKIGKVEDVDWYAVDLKAGQTVTLSVWGNRLENKIHDLQTHLDPIIVLRDSQGRELAADDNSQFADPLLSHEVKETGRYLIELRDTTYSGNLNWYYVLQATTGPVVASTAPMTAAPGQSSKLRVRGPGFPGETELTLNLADDLPSGPRLVSASTPNGETLPFPIVVSSLPSRVEEQDAPEQFEKAPMIELPRAQSGRLAEPNDIDLYRFQAKKGSIYEFEVVARRAMAATDPVLRIINAQGRTVTEVDDTFGKDPRLEWTAPADEVYAVQVSDLHSRGGPTFGYALLAQPARPDLVVTCDPDKFNVGPGSRVPVFVKVERRGGFKGPVELSWDDLPAGVASSPLTIAESMTQGVIVLSAAEDAKPFGGFVTLKAEGKSTGETGSRPAIRVNASPRQEIYLPGGGRGLFSVETLVLGVTKPSDIRVEAEPKTLTLKPGGTAEINVTVKRQGGYDKPVNLAVNLAHLGGVFGTPLPPGVTIKEAGSKTLLGPKEDKGKIILQAAPSASPIENVPITVIGHVSINFVVKTSYCSAPIAVNVVK